MSATDHCSHDSSSRVDPSPSDDADPLWRCDGCGLLYRWSAALNPANPNVMVYVNPWRELNARVESWHRRVCKQFMTTQYPEEVGPEREAYASVLAMMDALVPPDPTPVSKEVEAASRAMADEARAGAVAAVGLILQVHSIVEAGERAASEARTLRVDPDSFHANAFRRIAALDFDPVVQP